MTVTKKKYTRRGRGGAGAARVALSLARQISCRRRRAGAAGLAGAAGGLRARRSTAPASPPPARDGPRRARPGRGQLPRAALARRAPRARRVDARQVRAARGGRCAAGEGGCPHARGFEPPHPTPPAGRQMCGAPFPSRRRTRPRLPVRGLCRGARGRPCRARGREAARRPASPASPRLARRRCPKERRAADSARARLTPSRPLSPAPCGLDPSRAGYTPGAATR